MSKRYVPLGEIPVVSLTASPKVTVTRQFSIVDADPVDVDPINHVEWLDPLDPRFTAALNRTSVQASEEYHGDPLPTVSYRYYGTASATYLILAFNGYVHPDEVPRGIELQIPNLQQFLAAYQVEDNRKREERLF